MAALTLMLLFVTSARASASALAVHSLGTRGGAQSKATPLSKVLEMLDDMLLKCKDEKNSEETEFAAKHQWCDSTRGSLQKSIAEGAAQIEQLEADIAKAEADAEELGAAANQLLAEADGLEAEAENATSIRKKEKADYSATYTDFTESIDAVERAIAVLKSRTADIPQSLIQVQRSRLTPPEDKESIEALLAVNGGQAPKANAYEFQSGSAVAMLEKLRIKFQDERLALQKAELAAKHNYEVLMQKLTDNIKEAKETAAAKTSMKAQRLEDAATSKGDLGVTQTAKATDESTLSDTLSECSAASKEFESNQVVRAEEIKAIETAVGILTSDSVSGNAQTYLPAAAVQVAVSLAQLKRFRSDSSPNARQKAFELLQSRAKQLGSRYLSLAANRVSADPFAKVKKMVKDLIVKLMEDANSEADHNAYCTTELATNKQTRENKQAEVDELTAAVEKYTAMGDQIASEINEINDAVAEAKQQQAEATKIRQEEKATNAKTVEDAKESQLAVERAIKVLKEFYGKAAAASLLQVGAQSHGSAKHTNKEPYKGMQTENGNVLGFLEVILSDFARLETDTSSAEDQAQKSYDKYMDETAQDLAVKGTELDHKKNAKTECDANLADTKKQLELTQGELDAALTYYEKLKPDCVSNGLSYEERVAKRESEIQSLKEALDILNQGNLD